MSLNDLDVPLTELEAQIAALVEQAVALRYESGCALPSSPEAAPHVIQASLVHVRAVLDSLEPLYSRVIRIRGRCRRAAKQGRHIADDTWDTAVTRIPRQEYVGPRERYAEASLQSFDQQRDARAAERLLSVADEAFEAIKLAYDGLSSLRYDHVAWLRSFNFESSLER